MPEILCQPDHATVDFAAPVNLLETMIAAGIPVAHLCGGRARCSTCRVKVAAGLDQLSERTTAEQAMADRLEFPAEIRLACQTTVSESVQVRRLVLDEADAEMASQLGKGGYHGPVGREVEIAVMFADVAGYTTLAESLPPYDILHMLNRFFNGAGDIVEANGGRVDNYIGDAVLALFGVDGEPSPTAAAIRSGLGVIDVARNLDRYVGRIYGKPFRVRVGVDFGQVVFGEIGAERTARETAIGDVVNVASRLQDANKQVGTDMLVSASVRQGCTKEVEFGRSFELDLRGKVGRVTAHEVLRMRGDDAH